MNPAITHIKEYTKQEKRLLWGYWIPLLVREVAPRWQQFPHFLFFVSLLCYGAWSVSKTIHTIMAPRFGTIFLYIGIVFSVGEVKKIPVIPQYRTPRSQHINNTSNIQSNYSIQIHTYDYYLGVTISYGNINKNNHWQTLHIS